MVCTTKMGEVDANYFGFYFGLRNILKSIDLACSCIRYLNFLSTWWRGNHFARNNYRVVYKSSSFLNIIPIVRTIKLRILLKNLSNYFMHLKFMWCIPPAAVLRGRNKQHALIIIAAKSSVACCY